ncbi:MAG: phosphodiester glycosidase family protein, partial [Actinobacteria bacterium]|nr:phosphodiester glycosidase family protein [Actinomycetota bacterium]
AAFNGGFRLDGSRGGYYTERRTVQGLVNGRASLVITRDGKVTVGQWGRDVAMNPNVVSVRQNLDLIVDGGVPVPGLLAKDHSRWGATVGGRVYVWRSGVGVDRNGNLVYAAGPALSITSLANLLVDAGAVRAMELDINSQWVSYYTYSGTTPADIQGHKLLGDIQRPNDRYLKDGTRDFVALFAR